MHLINFTVELHAQPPFHQNRDPVIAANTMASYIRAVFQRIFHKDNFIIHTLTSFPVHRYKTQVVWIPLLFFQGCLLIEEQMYVLYYSDTSFLFLNPSTQ